MQALKSLFSLLLLLWTSNKQSQEQICPKKQCLFIHGAGMKGSNTIHPKDTVDTDTFEYWKNFVAGLQCEMHFVALETINTAYDDLDKREEDLTKYSLPDIDVVITHSMGNLMFAECLRQGKCGPMGNTKWVGLAAPWKGSFVMDPMWLFRRIAPEEKFNADGSLRLGYKSLLPENSFYEKTNAKEILKKNVSLAVCGTKSSGSLAGDYKLLLWKIWDVIRTMDIKRIFEPRDGSVRLGSCKVDELKNVLELHLNHGQLSGYQKDETNQLKVLISRINSLMNE